MKAQTTIFLPDGRRHSCEFDEVPLIGDRLLLGGSVFEVEERVWGLNNRRIAFPGLLVKEVEGENIPPSGRYEAASRHLAG